MKELSIEEKARRYDEAIKLAKDSYNYPSYPGFIRADVVFPELKESEDERIRTAIIHFISHTPTVPKGIIGKETMLAWLEKQDTKELKKTSIWKHWKDGICGNGEGKLIYLIKCGDDYSLTSCLAFECDYIELSELDDLIIEKQGQTFTKRDVDDAYIEGMACAKNELEKQGEQEPLYKIKMGKEYKCIASPRYSTFMTGEIYKPEDKFLCSLMNFCSDCFEPIEDGEQKPTDKVEPKFKVGDTMRTLQEAKDGWTDGMPFVVSIDSEYYNCNSEKIAIKDQDNYEYPPINRKQKPAWSEEDERLCSCIIEEQEESLDNLKNDKYGHSEIISDLKEMYRERIDWLKSLKQRIGG